MTRPKPPGRALAPTDASGQLADPLPTQSAELTISSKPMAGVEFSVGPGQPWGTAKGTVPPDQAQHLITTFGILGSASAGIGGAILTLHITPHLTGVALGELVVAFVAAVLIAVCGYLQAKQKRRRQKPSNVQARRARQP
jgi:hypothetical protein